MGVAIGTNVQAWDTQLDDIAALAVTDGNFIVGDGANWVAESGATAFTSIKQVATASATGVVELATQAEVDTGTDTTRVVTPATLNASKNYSVTDTSDTALATRASGGSQIGSTLSSKAIPTSGVIRITLLEAEFDTGASQGEIAIALDIGATKVWAISDNSTGTSLDTVVTIGAGVTGRKVGAGADIFSTGRASVSFDIVDKSFPTGAQDIKIFMGDRANSTIGEGILTGTTTTCRILVEVIDTT